MRASTKYKIGLLLIIVILFSIYLYISYEGFDALPDRDQDANYCAPGSWCPASNQIMLCPGGTYGDSEGNTTPDCSGKCEAGSVCPEGSTTATERPCPAGFFCVEGTGGANVPPVICPEGYYCEAGSAEPTECPAGTTCPQGTSNLPDAPT